MHQEGALSAISFSDLFSCAIQRLRSLCIELPSFNELTRVVHSAHSGFFSDVHHQINQLLSEPTRQKIDQLLIVPEGESFSTFEKVKAPPGPVGVESLTKEVKKLQTLRATGIVGKHLMNIPFKVKKLLFRRAKNETASEMRSPPEFIRYSLMACFIDIRTIEVIDSIVEIFVATIHRIKALLELGKVEKTIFLCNYLPSPEIKGEMQAGLNVVENWNGANDFIFYGRGGKFETNNPEEMEISMLCLHLLQNCLILINTILLEQTIECECEMAASGIKHNLLLKTWYS